MKIKAVLERLKPLVQSYIDSFPQDDADVQTNFLLKREHTARVCEEMSFLAGKLRLDSHETALAEICALLHDIGRFEQYHKYRTFMDPVSEDHAEIGLKVIDKHNMLKGLSEYDRSLVRDAVSNHNRRRIDPALERRSRFFTQMIRDADKLDIWSIIISHYKSQVKNDAITLGLSQENFISEKVFSDLMSGKMAKKEDFCTINDFKINQIAWVYDLNFSCSLERARDRGYLQELFSNMDSNIPGVTKFYCRAQAFIYGNGTFTR